MNVRLIATTHPHLSNIPNAEGLIVYCARVSNPANQDNTDTGAKLLRYCIQHGHWSVFEQASMTVEIITSRAISAQILRHRTQTRVYMTGTVRDWIHYLALRTKEDTQLEHRQIAEAIQAIFAQEFPAIALALSEAGHQTQRNVCQNPK